MKKQDSLFSKMSYASGDIYGGGAFLIVGILLLSFLTSVVGLTGTQAGLILLIGKVIDAITDPLMGGLSDKTKSKFGRRRIYFLFGSIPVLLSWVMLWSKVSIGNYTFFYYLVSFIFFSISFTIVMVPYNSILSEMISDYDLRSSYTGMRLAFSTGAAVLCAILPMMIVDAFSNVSIGYLAMGLFFGLIFGISWILVFLGTFEKQDIKVENDYSLHSWLSVFKNKSFKTYSIIFIFSQMAIDITMALALFYITSNLGRPGLFTPVMATLLVTQLVFMLLFSKLANVLGKKFPAYISAVVWIFGNIMLFQFDSKTPSLVVILFASLIGIGAAGVNLFSWAVLPDVIDIDELITGKRREGLYAGIATFLRKLSGGLVVGAIGVLLDLFGYSSNATILEPLTDFGLRFLFTMVPSIFLLASLFVLRHYRLTKVKYNTLRKVMDQYNQGIPNSSEDLLDLEDISGVESKYYFGKN